MFADEYLRIYIYIYNVYEKQDIVDKSKYILLCYFDIAPKTINMDMQCESTVHIYIWWLIKIPESGNGHSSRIKNIFRTSFANSMFVFRGTHVEQQLPL